MKNSAHFEIADGSAGLAANDFSGAIKARFRPSPQNWRLLGTHVRISTLRASQSLILCDERKIRRILKSQTEALA